MDVPVKRVWKQFTKDFIPKNDSFNDKPVPGTNKGKLSN